MAAAVVVVVRPTLRLSLPFPPFLVLHPLSGDSSSGPDIPSLADSVLAVDPVGDKALPSRTGGCRLCLVLLLQMFPHQSESSYDPCWRSSSSRRMRAWRSDSSHLCSESVLGRTPFRIRLPADGGTMDRSQFSWIRAATPGVQES